MCFVLLHLRFCIVALEVYQPIIVHFNSFYLFNFLRQKECKMFLETVPVTTHALCVA